MKIKRFNESFDPNYIEVGDFEKTNWSLEKKKNGRYLTNDGISDIPGSWR